MKRAEIAIVSVSVVVIVLSVGAFAMNMNRNAMQERLTEFEMELAGVTYIEEEYATVAEVNFKKLVIAINAKPTLWRELVAPPPPPKRIAAAPNLEKMLQGVTISSRLELGRGDSVKINVKTPADKRGAWKSVGDKINGLAIKEITKESVTFSLERGGKEYTYALPRT